MRKLFFLVFTVPFFIAGCGDIKTDFSNGKNCQILTETLNFGNVKLGESATHSAAVQCMQLDTLTVIVADLDGNFYIPADQSTVKTTSLAGTASVSVTFQPKSLGSKISAVQFKDSQGDTYDIGLLGSGSNITSDASQTPE